MLSSGNLYEYLNKCEEDLVGAEVGVSRATNLSYMLGMSKNIKKIFAIDPYLPYQDWCGYVSEDMQNENKQIARQVIENLNLLDRVEFVYKTSDEAFKDLEDGSLDFIYIDGDHSYEWAYKDFNNYYSKVKDGGIFAGHDFSLDGVKRALIEFTKEQGIDFDKDLIRLTNDSWFWYKRS